MNKTNKKGFTLAELLIVVAIIAVLVAIAIPVFTAQLEKSREAVDAANIRAEYAELMADAITGEVKTGADDYKVTLVQEVKGFATTFDWPENMEITPADATAKGTAKLAYSSTTGKVSVTFN